MKLYSRLVAAGERNAWVRALVWLAVLLIAGFGIWLDRLYTRWQIGP